ncbi:MAG: hypothetical protein L3J69_05415, partial [Desulfobacula sp.]|nr:hypothetical protein [Desulfobacula sp.]
LAFSGLPNSSARGIRGRDITAVPFDFMIVSLHLFNVTSMAMQRQSRSHTRALCKSLDIAI